jgi:hypothetical protein
VETQAHPTKKRDRSTLPSVASIVACFVFAYGFSRGSVLFQWILPAALMIGAFGFTFWPGRGRRGSSSES